MDNFVAWYYRFSRDNFILSHTLALLWRLPLTDAMVCCYDGVHSGSLEKRVKFITRAQTFCLFFFFAEDQVSSRLCMCICLCLSSVSMYRNYHDTQQWDVLIFKRSLANSSRTHTLSLALSFAYIHSRRNSVGIMFILFLVLKISRSFLEKAFFPSSFGRCNL